MTIPEVKLDLTESANTVTKAATELAQTALANPIKATSKLVTTAVNFINNLLFYPIQKYNIYAEHKLDKFKQSLEEKVKEIPDDKLTHPTISVWGNVCDSLKWNLDEEHIKAAFVNILMSDLNSDTKAKVNPAFIEIVKQISREEASFLKEYFSGDGINGIEVLDILVSVTIPPNSIQELYLPYGLNSCAHQFYAIVKGEKVIKFNDVCIDNLERLKLISIKNGHYRFIETSIVEKEFEAILSQCNMSIAVNNHVKHIYERKIFKPTAFGRDFIKIVCK